MLVALIAIALANSAFGPAFSLAIESPLPGLEGQHPASLRELVGDGLMVLFFLLVGLEIKREALVGNLADPAQRRLPVLAALAGMACPALAYLAVTATRGDLAHGWAIPAATDIAFAVGIIGLLGRRVPASLRLFLLTVAVVDDLGAVAVIALAYTAHIDPHWLGAAAGVWLAMVALNALGCRRVWAYVLMGAVLWWCVLHSGVHATVAGVATALTVPLGNKPNSGPLARLEHALAPWSRFVIVPLFALVHAGVSLDPASLSRLFSGSDALLPLGIALGLLLGKPLGIAGSVWLA
ncbi:MAG TPA: Na+/H+ antiporter NhaA, partial [Novosphingobium sp.]|nr:Na+/H+ antiporter NhaA [Novosphingobium sp.]